MKSSIKNLTPRATEIFLLRHGECEGGDIVRGRTDSPLSSFGEQQMERAINGRAEWTDIVSSPLSRCRDFAENIAEQAGLAMKVEPGFQEIDFGSWEGQRWDALQQSNPAALQAYFDKPMLSAVHGGEEFCEFLERVVKTWHDLMGCLQGDRVLIITHGGVIKTLLASLLKMPMERQFALLVPYACLSHLQLHQIENRQHIFLQSHNCSNSGA